MSLSSFCTRLAPPALALAAALATGPLRAGEFSDEFDRQRFKDGLQHEIAFREAAIHVAWGAEPLCDDTTEIEPFVLWSTRIVRKGLNAKQQALFKQATGIDRKSTRLNSSHTDISRMPSSA